ncbi:MAG: UDP-glucose/GDP-mannose dehydrogenase family protein [Proteobacteria bacterium]|nr:UDP-glucose/GDP-mannose dehydrogenase family protein [Pseudomonadota bacterium]
MRIAIIGTGYVGLVAGAGLSDFGNDVVCVDVDEERIAQLRRGVIPIHEPGLDVLVKRNLEAKRLRFSTSTVESVATAEVVIIAVGTPTREDSGAADLRYIEAAARDIGKGLTGHAVVVTKSTVPVGTADRVRSWIAAETSHEFSVASNPEFLKEGDAVNDFMKPSRVILGVDDERAGKRLRSMYEPFVRTNNRILMMDVRSAELSKYAANAMLATRISFMNELSLLAEKVGADIEKVRKGVGSDPRIGPKFLFPGPGYGGSCFPKDTRALIHTADEFGAKVGIVEAVVQANQRQKRVLGERVSSHFGGDLNGKRIAIWGLAFKPETDDIREAPSLVLIDALLAGGATVVGCDPVAIENTKREIGDRIEYTIDMYEAAKGADALIVVTEWHQFRRPDFARLKDLMAQPVLFDGRNIWPSDELRQQGYSYYGIGRPMA